jgi:hypothetical protein
MTLYHSTAIENKASIISEGLCNCVTDKLTLSKEQIEDEGVFGFDNIDSAREFGEDCCGGEYAIFSFQSDSHIIDPEYDGEALFSTSFKDVKFID